MKEYPKRYRFELLTWILSFIISPRVAVRGWLKVGKLRNGLMAVGMPAKDLTPRQIVDSVKSARAFAETYNVSIDTANTMLFLMGYGARIEDAEVAEIMQEAGIKTPG